MNISQVNHSHLTVLNHHGQIVAIWPFHAITCLPEVRKVLLSEGATMTHWSQSLGTGVATGRSGLPYLVIVTGQPPKRMTENQATRLLGDLRQRRYGCAK